MAKSFSDYKQNDKNGDFVIVASGFIPDVFILELSSQNEVFALLFCRRA